MEDRPDNRAKVKAMERRMGADADLPASEDGLGEEDLFMTFSAEEVALWEDMMKARKDNIVKRGEDFRHWLDKMTRRRMFIYSRIRKLDHFKKGRRAFLANMASTFQHLNEKLNVNDDGTIMDINNENNVGGDGKEISELFESEQDQSEEVPVINVPTDDER